MDINDGDDLNSVYELLRKYLKDRKKPVLRLLYHFKGVEPPSPSTQPPSQCQARTPAPRRQQITTTEQLNRLSNVLDSEEAAGNLMPALAAQWACRSS